MEVGLILVPYHLGVEGTGMGLGPGRFVQAGIHRELSSRGHGVHVTTVQPRMDEGQDEIAAVTKVNALLAEHVRSALGLGHCPLVLAGNCNAALGILAGLAARPIGVVWLDAHGDFNTPETSVSGFLDGMSLAMVAGLCHRLAWETLGSMPIPGAHVVHVGGRDFDEGETERLVEHGVCVLPVGQLKQVGLMEALRPALAALRSRVGDVYLHVDLDVLDPAEARAKEFAAPGGLSVRDVERIVRMIGETLSVRAATLAAYDPAYDEGGRALGAGIRLIHTIGPYLRRLAS